MTDEDLNEIVERAAKALAETNLAYGPSELTIVLCSDVPALVEEVKRLREGNRDE